MDKIKITKQEELYYSDLVSTWDNFNRCINEVSEIGLMKLFHVEQSGKNRLTMLRRIKGRYNKLRARREDRELVREYQSNQSVSP